MISYFDILRNILLSSNNENTYITSVEQKKYDFGGNALMLNSVFVMSFLPVDKSVLTNEADKCANMK